MDDIVTQACVEDQLQNQLIMTLSVADLSDVHAPRTMCLIGVIQDRQVRFW
jgi:hypothetical protein